ncbi:hypothetical protein [Cupriavidus necator]
MERDGLIHLQANGRFDALCEMLVDRLGEDDGVGRAGALLASWLGNALVARIESN